MARRKLKEKDLNRIRQFCARNPKRITTGLVVKDLATLYPQDYPALVTGTPAYSLSEENNYRKVIRDYLRELEMHGYLKVKAEPVYDNTGTLQKQRKRYIWYLPNVQPTMQVMIKMDEFKLMIQALCENGDDTDSYILEALNRILMGTNDISRWKHVLEEECRLMMMEPLYSQSHTQFRERLKKVFERLDSVFAELSSPKKD
jgi:TPP-dependent indolepyruvate ferredoxin oxidoreductase alpha subunit